MLMDSITSTWRRQECLFCLFVYAMSSQLACSEDKTSSPSERPPLTAQDLGVQSPTEVSISGTTGGEQSSTSTTNESCLNGSENCACYPNGSCDPKDGIPMACIDGRCVDRPVLEPGTLGGACDAENPCEAFQGQTLSCINGYCAISSCPSGQMGCPCGANGACLPREGQRGMCHDLFCVPFGCEPGGEGCSCADGECAEGLSCDLNVCRKVSSYDLELTVGERVRACDLLFEVDEGEVELRPNEQVMAKMSRRGRKVGVSLISRADIPLPTKPLSLVLDRPSSISPDAERLILVKSICYDRLGHRDARSDARIR